MKKSIHFRIILITVILTAVVNIFAWMAPLIDEKTGVGNWCDWYSRYILPVWVGIFGRISNLFPFSIGEILIVMSILFVIVWAVITVALIFLRKKEVYRIFVKLYSIVMCYILSVVFVIMTLNCNIMYHCSQIVANPKVEKREYTFDELEKVRNYVVEKCNTLSKAVQRDKNGYVVYSEDMMETARKAMHNIDDKYPKLGGYYPQVKKLAFSDIISQAYIGGYYFPFSLETNYNKNMYIMNNPATFCHEMSHIHGYIYEDEANFIGFLASIMSEDIVFQYSGYLSVLYYIDNDYWDAANEYDIERYFEQPVISDLVMEDNVFLLEETWEEVEENAVLETETVDKISDDFTDASLNLNGVKDGIVSYSRVVELVMWYYDGGNEL